MTAAQLRELFNRSFNLNKWPKTFEVDAHTYACVCQEVLRRAPTMTNIGDVNIVKVSTGKHGGIMFKNVELILDESTTFDEIRKLASSYPEEG